MTFLNVVIAIFLFFTLLFLIPIKITIDYSDEVKLSVSILHLIKIKLLPKREKKIKISDYTERKIAKREKKRQKKEAKAKLKRAKRAEAKKQKKLDKKARKDAERAGAVKKEVKPSLLDSVNLIASLVEVFFKKFFKYLKIKVARLRIVVATDDAAKTAVLYGAVSQAVSYIIALLDTHSNLSQTRNVDFGVDVDFCATKPSADVCLSFSLRIGHVVKLALALLWRFIKSKMNAPRNKAPSDHVQSKKTNSNKKKQGR